MKTLLILTLIWGIISHFRIAKYCKDNNRPYDLFDQPSFFNYMGVILGAYTAIFIAIAISNVYLP